MLNPFPRRDNDYFISSEFHMFPSFSLNEHFFRGSETPCRSVTGRANCSDKNTKNCIRITVIGLCGGWSTTLRALPVTVSCPKLKDTAVVLEHVGTPSSITESNIVLFSFVADYMNMDVWRELRKYRPPDQMWVFQTEESPYYAIGLLPPWIFRNDSYDISNTYRTSADIYTPYGNYEPFRNEEANQVNLPLVNLAYKTRFMIWISSHCETLQWDRTAFVKDLQKVMKVDIFGKCGNNSLCKNKWEQNCAQEVDDFVKTYKFSLALENCCCEDYITEKLWHTLTIGVVPVVIGPHLNNYKKLVPPGSFIHIDQFDSVENLKSYLEYLDQNDTAYLEYFQWRTKGTVHEHTIKEHYQNHLSDNIMCAIVDQYTERKLRKNAKVTASAHLEMFDPYGPEWKGTCHSCGENQWIQNYEYPSNHKRKSKTIWT
ncbi:putative alpha-(1,3)-fucosyltransferase 6-like [Apostichopus japonicus]|uniref:Fucosyltransferase n=1 Tax=Stichopus japonicus TaxID=307972 RepID=A0A2G8K9D6_STIJA|nr:putative alpha-(1,3)-fucosyltransferase 6-like [Apostichopus japonicus]